MPEPKSIDPIEAAAAEWFIRRDRGLSDVEEAAYACWLQETPRHAAALERVEKLWHTLDPVFAHRASVDGPPDADLLAPPRPRLGWWLPVAAIAATAAAAGFVLFLRVPERPADTAPLAPATSPTLVTAKPIFHPGPERRVLPDGSTVDLAEQAEVEVQFTPGERRVRLVRGTAFFTVAKNPDRPFIVDTGEVNVRAVGTAFSVALQPSDVSVLVTEGRVRVQEQPAAAASADVRELSALDAGEQGVVRHATPDRLEVSVTRLTPAEIERALYWQGPRLEFTDLPLATLVDEFNRYGHKRLVVGDAATGSIRVGGNFRVDNIDGFLRVLDVLCNVSAVSQGDEFILRQKPAR